MKLYTEEQVKLLLDLAKLKLNGEMYSKDVLFKQVAPIELPNYDNVTRFEVIDHSSKMRGRYVVEYGVKVEVSIQDDGRTMKVFLTN